MNEPQRTCCDQEKQPLEDAAEAERSWSQVGTTDHPARAMPARPAPSTEGERHERSGGGARVTRGGSNRLLTPEEVAERLKVSETAVRNKYRAWGLKPQKGGASPAVPRTRHRDLPGRALRVRPVPGPRE